MKIGVISDTHVPRRAKAVPPEVFQIFDGVDLILHAGDLTDERVLIELQAMAPVEAVYGNCDSVHLRMKLRKARVLEYEGYRIGLVHGDGPGTPTPMVAYRTFSEASCDCVVFGHSHRPYNERYNGVLLFNPGSPTDKRGLPHYSCGILELNSHGISPNIHFFARDK